MAGFPATLCCDVPGCDVTMDWDWSPQSLAQLRENAARRGWGFVASAEIRDEEGAVCKIDLCPAHSAKVADRVLHSLTAPELALP